MVVGEGVNQIQNFPEFEIIDINMDLLNVMITNIHLRGVIIKISPLTNTANISKLKFYIRSKNGNVAVIAFGQQAINLFDSHIIRVNRTVELRNFFLQRMPFNEISEFSKRSEKRYQLILDTNSIVLLMNNSNLVLNMIQHLHLIPFGEIQNMDPYFLIDTTGIIVNIGSLTCVVLRGLKSYRRKLTMQDDAGGEIRFFIWCGLARNFEFTTNDRISIQNAAIKISHNGISIQSTPVTRINYYN